MAVVLTDEQQAEVDATTVCVDTLFGEGALALFVAAQMGSDEIAACIKQVIVDCLTDPDTNPITKEMLGEIIQGVDVDGDGVVGRVAGAEDSLIQRTDGTKILSVSKSVEARNAKKG